MPNTQEVKEKPPVDQWNSLCRNLFLGLIYFISALSILYLLLLGGYEAFTQYRAFGLIIWLVWLGISLTWIRNKSWQKIQVNTWPIKDFDDLANKTFHHLHSLTTFGFITIHMMGGVLYLFQLGFFGLILSFLVMTGPAFGVIAWFRKEIKRYSP